MAVKRPRADHQGPHRQAFEKARRVVIAKGTYCAICGQPVDKKLKWPDPMSATADHIIPISKGGHPSDIANLQLTHLICKQSAECELAGSTRMGTGGLI